MEVPSESSGEHPAVPSGPPGRAPDETGGPDAVSGVGDRVAVPSDSGNESATTEADRVLTVTTATVGLEALNQAAVKERSMVFELVKEEVIRAAVALLLILLLGGVVIGAFVKAKTWDDTKQLLDLVLPAVTALLGSALGFYFGKKSD
jgi:hypothetical protein